MLTVQRIILQWGSGHSLALIVKLYITINFFQFFLLKVYSKKVTEISSKTAKKVWTVSKTVYF